MFPFGREDPHLTLAAGSYIERSREGNLARTCIRGPHRRKRAGLTVRLASSAIMPVCSAQGADAGAVQKWNFLRGGCDKAPGTARLLDMLKDSKDASCTPNILG